MTKEAQAPVLRLDNVDDEVEIRYDGVTPRYVNAQALLLSFDEACLLHARLGEFLRRAGK